jgi:hypothetical protein
MPTFRSTLVLGLLLFAGACKPSPQASYASEPPAYGGDVGGMEEADMDAPPPATVSTESAPEEKPSRTRFEHKRGKKLAKDAMASPEPVTTTTPDGTSAAGPERAVEDQTQDLDTRYIIYVANMTVAVFNLDDAIAKAEALPEAVGGYVHSMDGGTLVLRVPAKKLRQALTDIAELGVVEHRSLSAQDVSAEFVDIESRIRALETTQKQLLELMGKARTVDEALHVRQALDGVTSELEVLKGRMRQLDNLIAYSTITVTLMERGPHTGAPSSNDPFKWADELGVESTEWK